MMNSLWKVLGILVVGLFAFAQTGSVEAACPHGATLTVHSGQSVQAAVNAADPGDTIQVEPGVYNEAVVIPTDCLTLLGGWGEGATGWAVMDGTGLSLSPGIGTQAFRVQADHITISGFEMRDYSSSEAGWGSGVMAMIEPAHEGRIEGNWIHDMTGHGIEVGWDQDVCSTDWKIEGNLISDVGSMGVVFWCGEDVKVEDNTISSAKMGVLFDGQPNPPQDIKIEGNEISGAFQAGIWVQAQLDEALARDIKVVDNNLHDNAAGIFLRRVTDSKVEGNQVRDQGTWGITLNRADGNKISENHVARSGRPGLQLIYGSDQNTIEENTIEDSTWDGILVTFRRGPPCNGNLIKGNTVTGSGLDGILVQLGASDNLIKENMVSGSATQCDLAWDSTGSGNCWMENTGTQCPALPACD